MRKPIEINGVWAVNAYSPMDGGWRKDWLFEAESAEQALSMYNFLAEQVRIKGYWYPAELKDVKPYVIKFDLASVEYAQLLKGWTENWDDVVRIRDCNNELVVECKAHTPLFLPSRLTLEQATAIAKVMYPEKEIVIVEV